MGGDLVGTTLLKKKEKKKEKSRVWRSKDLRFVGLERERGSQREGESSTSKLASCTGSQASRQAGRRTSKQCNSESCNGEISTNREGQSFLVKQSIEHRGPRLGCSS